MHRTNESELSKISNRRQVSKLLSGDFRKSLESMVLTYKLSMTDNHKLSNPTRNDLSSPTTGVSSPLIGDVTSLTKRDTNDVIGDLTRFNDQPSELRLLTVKLTVLCRLIDHFGWYQPTLTDCSARIGSDTTVYTPLGMLFSKAKASNLLILYADSVIPDQNVDISTLNLHQHLLNRYKCVITVNTPVCAAIASISCGLLPLSKDYLVIGEIEYTDAESLRLHIPEARVIFIRNQGLVVVGNTVEEAFYHLFHVLTACTVQTIALSAGSDNILPMQCELQSNPLCDSHTADTYQSHFEYFSKLITDENLSNIASLDYSQVSTFPANPFLPQAILSNKNTNPFLSLSDDELEVISNTSICDQNTNIWDFTRYLYPSEDKWNFLPQQSNAGSNPITYTTEIKLESTLSQFTFSGDENDDMV
ncbi:Alpha-adducin isoform X6 [Oopsacas minuta]|uniref:Alpha-adducin isoform X6 n=1 Tax=Oopsacas minuta TaxID=111878 RepID=A0AAV7KLM6_9METZ|nr:Alpha-adducin isoform X6 [Oopsacas minuta]